MSGLPELEPLTGADVAADLASIEAALRTQQQTEETGSSGTDAAWGDVVELGGIADAPAVAASIVRAHAGVKALRAAAEATAEVVEQLPDAL